MKKYVVLCELPFILVHYFLPGGRVEAMEYEAGSIVNYESEWESFVKNTSSFCVKTEGNRVLLKDGNAIIFSYTRKNAS